MRPVRSIVFYAWLVIGVELLLAVGVVTFVLVGAAYQRSAGSALQHRVQRMELANLTLNGDFLDSQRALTGYQATRQNRFITTFYADQGAVVTDLALLRRLAWPGVLGLLKAEAGAAATAFASGDRAVRAPQRSRLAARQYALASAHADTFAGDNAAMQRSLAAESDVMAARSVRTLGIGSGGTAAVLVASLMLPVAAAAIALRWASRPLHNVTATIRDRAAGDHLVRAVPGGPGDIRELAEALNTMADESDRLRDAEQERAGLLEMVRAVSVRTRRHLEAGPILHEAVAALTEHLAADEVWVGLISGEEVQIAQTDHAQAGQVMNLTEIMPPGFLALLTQRYRDQASYPIQDLRSGQHPGMPAGVRDMLLGMGAVSLLLTPFGVGEELLGALILLRMQPGRPWSQPEIEAVQSIGGDIGQAFDHARVHERDEKVVAELKALDRARSSFLASASHDLRAPLTSIAGNLEMVLDGDAGPVTSKQTEMLAVAGRSVRRLGNLIEDMLAISKIELGAFSSELRPMDLAGLVPEAVEMVEASAASGGLTLEVATGEGELMVSGDAGQLERVLMNLLTNAVKYTPGGGRVSLRAAREGGDAVVVVRDTGIGIPEREQQSLFAPFFRASNAVERSITGSGLGLSIVRKIIEQHHGTLDLVSAENAGTTVTVRIPLLPGAAGGPGPGPDGGASR